MGDRGMDVGRVPGILPVDGPSGARESGFSGFETPYRRREPMTPEVVNILLFGVIVLASIVCIFGPIAVLGVMFWKWHTELRQTSRLRLARSTQVK
jgi:hypothetical protein